MDIIFITLFSVVVAVSSLVSFISCIVFLRHQLKERNKEKSSKARRKYIEKHRDEMFLQNTGTTMDNRKIYGVSCKDMGC